MTFPAQLKKVFGALAILIVFGMYAPSVTAAQKPTVRVDWTDPAQFSEMQNLTGLNQTNPDVWLGEFALTIRRHARRVLKTGQSLSVTITDVTLAGTVRSGSRAGGVRIVDKNSPPRIKLSFKASLNKWRNRHDACLRADRGALTQMDRPSFKAAQQRAARRQASPDRSILF